MLGEASFPAPVGVGSNDPHAVALVRRTDVPSSKHTPASIKPQVGKPREDDVEASSAKHRRVFGEDKRRPNLANDSEHLEPQAAALACQSSATPGAGDVLAGEASADNVDASRPRRAVEGSDVIPYREGLEHSVALSLSEHALAVLVDLDGADGAPSEQMRRQ